MKRCAKNLFTIINYCEILSYNVLYTALRQSMKIKHSWSHSVSFKKAYCIEYMNRAREYSVLILGALHLGSFRVGLENKIK